MSTIISAIFLIFVGAVADRSSHPTKLFGAFAWMGAIAASLMFLVTGTNWQLGVVLFMIANLCLGSSLVIYDSLLVRIAGPNDRDRVSSKGWAFGYLGAVSYTHLRAHETVLDLVCRLLLEQKKHKRYQS